MPIPEDDFNVAKFLYYNPELSSQSNITNNTQAYEWAFYNDTTGMVYKDDSIPTTFNSETFILDFKRNIDASSLNRTINAAMLAEGFTQTQLNQRAKYFATIYQDAVLVEVNRFKFNALAPVAPEDAFSVTPRTLDVGDHIKLMNNDTKVFEYAIVDQVLDSETIQVRSVRKQYTSLGDSFKVIGIRLYDYTRLAKINYLRGLDPPPQVPNADAVAFIDKDFNPELYRLLYPDVAPLSDLLAYHDYVSRRDNNDLRIGRVKDIPLDSNLFNTTFDNLGIKYRLTFDDAAALRWGDKYVYGISEDDVTKANLLNPSQDQLITEYAIKQYVDRPYAEHAIFNDVTVNGTTRLEGPTFINGDLNIDDLYVNGNLFARSNLSVNGDTTLVGSTNILGDNNFITNSEIANATHTSRSLFKTDVYMESNLYINGYSLGPRIGIGPPVPVDYTSTPTGLYDAKLKNALVDETLEVGAGLPPATVALRVAGFIQADNLNYVSDSRLKVVKGTIDGPASLDILDSLVPIMFAYKDAPQVDKMGFLADDVERIVPGAVSRIAVHESSVSQIASATNADMLSFPNPHGLYKGDEAHIVGLGWVTVVDAPDLNTAQLATPLDKRDVVIDRVRLRNVRSIDYPSLVTTMWSALRELKKRLT